LIENREALKPGDVLVASYKGQTLRCDVTGLLGDVRFQVEGSTLAQKSPSAAAKEAAGGGSFNGWAFWSLVGAEMPIVTTKPKIATKPRAAGKTTAGKTTAAPRAKRAKKVADPEAGDTTSEPAPKKVRPRAKPLASYKMIKRVPSTQVEEGQAKWFCDACMQTFEAPADPRPTVCGNCGADEATVIEKLRGTEGELVAAVENDA